MASQNREECQWRGKVADSERWYGQMLINSKRPKQSIQISADKDGGYWGVRDIQDRRRDVEKIDGAPE